MQADNTCYVCLNSMTPTDSCKLPECDHWIHTKCMLNCIATNNVTCGLCRSRIMERIQTLPDRPISLNNNVRIDSRGTVIGNHADTLEIAVSSFKNIQATLKKFGVHYPKTFLITIYERLEQLYPYREHLPNYTRWTNYVNCLLNYKSNITNEYIQEMAEMAGITNYTQMSDAQIEKVVETQTLNHYLATGGVPCPTD